MISKDTIKHVFAVTPTYGVPYKRFGSEHDGGYVCADDFSKNDFLISCGVGDGDNWKIDTNFEQQALGIINGAHLYDYSISSLPGLPKNADFFQAEIGKDVGLKEMIDMPGVQEDYILKMDIEGAEWEVFNEANSVDISKFRQIVLELHWFKDAFSASKKTKQVVSSLLNIKKTHNLVAVHGNNHRETFEFEGLILPDVAEVLFLRKDSYRFEPHDDLEVSDRPDVLFSPCTIAEPEIYLKLE